MRNILGFSEKSYSTYSRMAAHLGELLTLWLTAIVRGYILQAWLHFDGAWTSLVEFANLAIRV